MSNRKVHIYQTVIVGLLLFSALAMQGCVAIVWLGTVGIDRIRTSDIEFQPFENSWEVGPQERQHVSRSLHDASDHQMARTVPVGRASLMVIAILHVFALYD